MHLDFRNVGAEYNIKPLYSDHLIGQSSSGGTHTHHSQTMWFLFIDKSAGGE